MAKLRWRWARGVKVAGMSSSLDRSTADGGTLVRIREVHKHFTRGSERIEVLKGANLEIPPGDFLALMGPSGSGKTTLLNLMGGLDTPDEGAVEGEGVDVRCLNSRRLSRGRSQKIRVSLP